MAKFFNPLLLLVVLCAVLSRTMSAVADEEVGSATDAVLLTLCVTLAVIYIAVAVARALAHRGGSAGVVWGLLYLMMAGVLFSVAMQRPADDALAEAYRSHYDAWRQGADPCAVDESGDCLLTLAASLGKVDVLKRLLENPAALPAELKARAALLAASARREKSLAMLLDAGVGVNEPVEGSTLLCAAAQNSCAPVVTLLLSRGADPDLADAEGSTPLIYAAMAQDVACVRLLLEAGADPKRCNAEGRNASSFSTLTDINRLLDTPPVYPTP